MKLEPPILKNKENKKDNVKDLKCKYFLIFLDILLSGVDDLTEINKELENGIKELIESGAEELDISKEIIIPLENVVFVEDLKRELEEKNRIIEEIEKELIKEKLEKKRILEEKEKEKLEKMKIQFEGESLENS